MHEFKITSDRHVLLDGQEIEKVLAVDIHIEAGNTEVSIRLPADKVDVSGYTDWIKKEEGA